MSAVLIRRLVSLVITLFAVSLIIYLVMGLLPGDPAAIMLGTSASPDTLAALQKQMGLDQPLLLRYIHWLGGVFRGDLGQSYTYGVPVAGLIVSCAWRKNVLTDRPDLEVRSVAEGALGGLPLAGYPSLGEIAPLKEDGCFTDAKFHNNTCVVLVIGEAP